MVVKLLIKKRNEWTFKLLLNAFLSCNKKHDRQGRLAL